MCELEPAECGLPGVRTLVRIVSRTEKKGKIAEETGYYAACQKAAANTRRQWGRLVRGHWGGVEIRNYWVRDHCHREDGTRSRDERPVGNLILLRNALPAVIERHRPPGMGRPEYTDRIAAGVNPAMYLLLSKP